MHAKPRGPRRALLSLMGPPAPGKAGARGARAEGRGRNHLLNLYVQMKSLGKIKIPIFLDEVKKKLRAAREGRAPRSSRARIGTRAARSAPPRVE